MKIFFFLFVVLSPLFAKACPYYFVAVHCDLPVTQPIGENFEVLRQMVAKANRHGVKLTIMFTVPWAKFIMKSPQRIAEVRIWQSQGHEIAAHHHGLYSRKWDGYSDYDPSYAEAIRIDQGENPEPYQGCLRDLMRDLRPLGGPIISGCMNEERDKADLPKEIVYSTCGGYLNYGNPGRISSDFANAMNGRNEFVTVGWWNGVIHKWLSHFMVTSFKCLVRAENVFNQMPDWEIYGAIFHATERQAIWFNAYADFLGRLDSPWKSMTVREIMEFEILPELMTGMPQFLPE